MYITGDFKTEIHTQYHNVRKNSANPAVSENYSGEIFLIPLLYFAENFKDKLLEKNSGKYSRNSYSNVEKKTSRDLNKYGLKIIMRFSNLRNKWRIRIFLQKNNVNVREILFHKKL